MADEEEANTLRFHYIKSASFHTVHMDGGIGAPTPNGGLHLAVFSERPAIPTQIDIAIGDGKLGEEVSRIGKTGIVRELSVDLMMSLATARAMREWFDKNIKLAEAQLAAAAQKKKGAH